MRRVSVHIILATLALATAAHTHAVLVSSVPKDRDVLATPPDKVILRFDSRIEKRVARVTLTRASRKIALPKPKNGYTAGAAGELVIPMPKLKPGSYRLEYRVLATDGHITPGLIRFAVKGGKAP